MRPVGETLTVLVVKCVDRDAEAARIEADIVQRYQAVIDIEGRVVHALGHHRGGIRLEAQGELSPLAPDALAVFTGTGRCE